MGKPNYRVVVSFDPKRAVFTARAPELEHLTGDGPSRKDAIAKLEEEIDSQLANMLSHGTAPPKAVDEIEHDGEVHAKVSRGLHRDLVYLASSEGVELDQIVSELLSAALAVRQNVRPGQRAPRAQSHDDDVGNRAESHHHAGGADRDGNRADGGGGGGRRPFSRGHNPQILDDRANFIEYVRGLEQTGGAPARGPGGHRGGGHNPNNGSNNNRRRRGGGGPAGGGGGGGQQQGRDGNRHQGGQQHRGQQHGRPQPQHGSQAGGQPQGGGHAPTPPVPSAPAPSRPGSSESPE